MRPEQYDDGEMEEIAEYNADRYRGEETTEGSIEDMMQYL